MHPHGTAVAVAACAGLAKLWGYTAPELAAAVQQGAGLTVPADWNAARVGATVRNLFTGVSVQNAFIATASIRCGLRHNPGALDQVFGRILGTAFDASALTSALGTRWCIGEGVCFKRHACCRGAHGALGGSLNFGGTRSLIRKRSRASPCGPTDPRRCSTIRRRGRLSGRNSQFPTPSPRPWCWGTAGRRVRRGQPVRRADPRAGPARPRRGGSNLHGAIALASTHTRRGSNRQSRARRGVRAAGRGGRNRPAGSRAKVRATGPPVIGKGRAATVCDVVGRIDALEDVSLLTRLLIPSSA